MYKKGSKKIPIVESKKENAYLLKMKYNWRFKRLGRWIKIF